MKLPLSRDKSPEVSSVILLVAEIPDVGEPVTNCKFPPLFVVKSFGDSYMLHALPPNHSIPSSGPGSAINILFTLFKELLLKSILLPLPAVILALAAIVIPPVVEGNSNIPTVLSVILRSLVPLTNCKFPAEFVVRLSGDS